MVIGHQVVGLVLGHVQMALVLLPCVLVAQLQGVDGPDQGHKERAEDEHDRLFVNDSEVVLIEVVELDGLHCDGHQGCRKEHTQCILKCKREVLVSLIVVLLKMGEVVEHVPHYEFIEQHDPNQRYPSNNLSNCLLCRCGGRVGVLFLLLDGCVEVVGLDELYEVKDHSDNQQEEQAEPPTNK